MSFFDHVMHGGPRVISGHVGKRRIPEEPPSRTSQRGRHLMHKFEGFRAVAYPDPGSSDGHPWTIGYGTTRYPDGSPVREGDHCSMEQAQVYFAHDLAAFERAVLQAVEVTLTQGQLDALVSFTYNVGKNALRRSTLLRKLNAGDYDGAADEFLRWNKNDGKVMRGLVRRRAAERDTFTE